jgi:hypothetical protein
VLFLQRQTALTSKQKESAVEAARLLHLLSLHAPVAVPICGPGTSAGWPSYLFNAHMKYGRVSVRINGLAVGCAALPAQARGLSSVNPNLWVRWEYMRRRCTAANWVSKHYSMPRSRFRPCPEWACSSSLTCRSHGAVLCCPLCAGALGSAPCSCLVRRGASCCRRHIMYMHALPDERPCFR